MPPLKISFRDYKPVHMKGIGGKRILRFLFGHVGLLLLVTLYAVGGAFILMAIERSAEADRFAIKKRAAKDLQNTRDYIINYAWYQSAQNHGENKFKKLVRQNLVLYHDFTVESVKNRYYDQTPYQWNYDWTFPKALLFTVTTMGAIGYGHITPKTSFGQFFCIYYGMIGIPLLLLFLANIGNFLAKVFRYIYSRMCCRLCRIRRNLSELKPPSVLRKGVLSKQNVGDEPYMPTEKVDVPVVVNLCVIVAYLLIGGALFSAWEGWQLHEAVYFTFITLTTIGFGDYVPGNSFNDKNTNFVSTLKMLATIVFTIFGMALVSMVINLMQEQIAAKAKWFASEIGMSENSEKDALRYKVRRHDPEKLQWTPADKDGNQKNYK